MWSAYKWIIKQNRPWLLIQQLWIHRIYIEQIKSKIRKRNEKQTDRRNLTSRRPASPSFQFSSEALRMENCGKTQFLMSSYNKGILWRNAFIRMPFWTDNCMTRPLPLITNRVRMVRRVACGMRREHIKWK